MKFQERKILFSISTLGVLLFFGLWLKGLSYPFVYDDQWTIVNNPAVRGPISRPTQFFADPRTVALPDVGMHTTIYRPLATLMFALDAHLWGLKPALFRFWNVVGHFFNGVLLFLVLWRRLGLKKIPSLLAVFIFWFHPVQVETVQWITQRSNVFCLFFMLTALYFFLENPISTTSRILGGTAFLLALLSKEVGVVTPVLLLALDKNRKTHVRLYVALGLMALSYVLLRSGLLGQFGQRAFRGGDWLGNGLIGAVSFLEYIKLLLWPWSLTISHYQYVDSPWESVWPWVGVVAQLLFFGCVLILWKIKQVRVWQALLWVYISLFLVLGFFPTDTFVAERFLYMALPGFALLLAVLFGNFSLGKAVLAALLIFYVGRSYERIDVFQTERQLWQSAVETEPNNAFAWASLGSAYAVEGDNEKAVQAYYRCLQSGPSSHLAKAVLSNLSRLAIARKDYTEALIWMQKASRVEPPS